MTRWSLNEAVLTCTHNVWFDQKLEKYVLFFHLKIIIFKQPFKIDAYCKACLRNVLVCLLFALRPRQTATDISGRPLILTDKPPRGSLPIRVLGIHSFDARLESAKEEEWP